MELQINRLKIGIEKLQEMFTKDLEEIKKSQSIMNNVVTEIKRTLEGTNSRMTEAEDMKRSETVSRSVVSTLCNPMEPTRLSVHRILQARILEWEAIPFPRGSI